LRPPFLVSVSYFLYIFSLSGGTDKLSQISGVSEINLCDKAHTHAQAPK
jgi:hypothetical protein